MKRVLIIVTVFTIWCLIGKYGGGFAGSIFGLFFAIPLIYLAFTKDLKDW